MTWFISVIVAFAFLIILAMFCKYPKEMTVMLLLLCVMCFLTFIAHGVISEVKQ